MRDNSGAGKKKTVVRHKERIEFFLLHAHGSVDRSANIHIYIHVYIRCM